MRRFPQARLRQPAAGGDCLGNVRDCNSDEERRADAPADDRQPENDRLRNAVQHDPEDDRQRRAPSLQAARVLAVGAAHSVDQKVACKEGQRTSTKA
jgi:hypothetical protein